MSDERPYCGSDHCPITLSLHSLHQADDTHGAATRGSTQAADTPGHCLALPKSVFDAQAWLERFNAVGADIRQLRADIAQGTEAACRAWGYSHGEQGWVHLPKDFTVAMTKATQSYSNTSPALSIVWEPRYLAETAIEVRSWRAAASSALSLPTHPPTHH